MSLKIILVLCFLLPSFARAAEPQREWTILVYSAGDEGSKAKESDLPGVTV